VLGTYAAFQLLTAWSATSSWWWRNEWLRRTLQARHPRGAVPAGAPPPTWQDWLPSAVTAVVLIGALVAIGLAMVGAGRRWPVALVVAVPLIPYPITSGLWAPQLSNQVVYAIIWPVGASAPSPGWAWLSAGVEALVVALPAVALSAVVVERRPELSSGQVLARLAPAAAAAAAVLAWNSRAGQPQDWVAAARTATWVIIGALLLTGGLRRRWALGVLVIAAAVANGLVRWSTGADGTLELIVDPTAWAFSAAAVLGGAWALAAPAAAGPLRWWQGLWRASIASEAERRSVAQLPAAPRRGRGQPPPSRPPGANETGEGASPAPALTHRARPTPVGGGRHRA